MIAAAARFDANQLGQLLGPVALYPDALIALILPASTASSDVVLAARFLRDGNDPAQAENQPWDDSVRALARFPDVIKWMDVNLAWTKQLGEAFLAQPTEVMNAVQRLRAKAQAAGTLVSTPQQQVVVEPSAITIIPAQPDVIYVPYYDPEVVYGSQPRYYSSAPYVNFGVGYSTGFWLSYNLDWDRRQVCAVYYADRERHWREHPDYWRRPFSSNHPGYVSPPHYTWEPRSGYPRSNYTNRGNYAPPAAAPFAPPNRFEDNATWRSGSPPREPANRADLNRPGATVGMAGPTVPTPAPQIGYGPRRDPALNPVSRAPQPVAIASPPPIGETWNRGGVRDTPRYPGAQPANPSGAYVGNPNPAGARSPSPPVTALPGQTPEGSRFALPRSPGAQQTAPGYAAPAYRPPQIVSPPSPATSAQPQPQNQAAASTQPQTAQNQNSAPGAPRYDDNNGHRGRYER